MVFPDLRIHSNHVVMSTPEMMKPGFAKEARSGLHQFITNKLPFGPAPDARFEFMGGVIVVGLSAVMLFLMRFLVAD